MKGKALVSPATWINDADILDDQAAAQAWADKSGLLRFIFAGRLTSEKGVASLLDALEDLDRRGIKICFDMIGKGELQDLCEERLKNLKNVRARMLSLVPYGPAFFELVRGYDAVVVPSLSDEQPRIIFDAYSQAVPVIASATPGHRDILREDTGAMFPVGDAGALASVLEGYSDRRDELRKLGLAARDVSRSYTHKAMHEVRARLIRDL